MTGFNDEGHELSTLLHDAVSDVEPTDRLAEIRRVADARPRRLGWYAAGGAMLAAAAAVTAIALITSQTPPRADDPGPGPATSPPAPLKTEAVYYIGHTPVGPRLFRYFQTPEPGQDVLDLLTQTPADPDYRTAWAPGSFASLTFDGPVPGQIEVTIADASLRKRPPGMTEPEAALAIEQVIYTVQGAARAGERLPVQFRHNGNPIDQVLGVPTSEPLAAAPQLDVLSLVSISNPGQGRVVEGSFTANGRASSYEGLVPWELRAEDGTVVRDGYAIAGQHVNLIPWETEPIDVSDLVPGTYTFVASTSDPSNGEGVGVFTDTRTVLVE